MSQANIDLFAAKVAQDQALLSSLTTGIVAPSEFVERAIAAGQEAGLAFTPAEAQAWIAAQATTDKSGELSDVQLEGVAGGKGGFPGLPIPGLPTFPGFPGTPGMTGPVMGFPGVPKLF